jgi:hypothetical protein
MTTRRNFLVGAGTSGLALGTLGLPGGTAFAGTAAPGDLKFIFVVAQGGWDTTRVFATEFDNGNVDMEPDADLATAGDLVFVDHGDRPSVRTFMEANHARTIIVNGVMVRSIAHEICTMIVMTGATSGLEPDWGTLLGDNQRDRYTLPHLVMGGPNFPGSLGVAVARAGSNGQLEGLLSGDILDVSDVDLARLRTPSESLVDSYLSRRSSARASAATSLLEAQLTADFHESLTRARDLKDLRYVMDFTAAGTLEDLGSVAVEALQLGISRCVTLGHPAGSWDTHADNDTQQSALWEDLFGGLSQIQAMLDDTPGTTSASLADETVVVVLSELGRTPLLNEFNGKDHWPYTGVLMFGNPLGQGRVIGGFDEAFYGQNVDTTTGDVVASGGTLVSSETIGATLLAMADIDPQEHLPGVDPLMSVIG